MKADRTSMLLGAVGLLLAGTGAVFVLHFLSMSLRMQDHLEAGGTGGGSTIDQVTLWSSPALIAIGLGLTAFAAVRSSRLSH